MVWRSLEVLVLDVLHISLKCFEWFFDELNIGRVLELGHHPDKCDLHSNQTNVLLGSFGYLRNVECGCCFPPCFDLGGTCSFKFTTEVFSLSRRCWLGGCSWCWTTSNCSGNFSHEVEVNESGRGRRILKPFFKSVSLSILVPHVKCPGIFNEELFDFWAQVKNSLDPCTILLLLHFKDFVSIEWNLAMIFFNHICQFILIVIERPVEQTKRVHNCLKMMWRRVPIRLLHMTNNTHFLLNQHEENALLFITRRLERCFADHRNDLMVHEHNECFCCIGHKIVSKGSCRCKECRYFRFHYLCIISCSFWNGSRCSSSRCTASRSKGFLSCDSPF